MNIAQQNKQFYATKPRLGTADHCQCDDCQLYARNIVKNKPLVAFLIQLGIDPLKPDEVWGYKEEDGYQYFTVDYFEIYATQPESVTFDNVTVTISRSIYANPEQLPYNLAIEAKFIKLDIE